MTLSIPRDRPSGRRGLDESCSGGGSAYDFSPGVVELYLMVEGGELVATDEIVGSAGSGDIAASAVSEGIVGSAGLEEVVESAGSVVVVGVWSVWTIGVVGTISGLGGMDISVSVIWLSSDSIVNVAGPGNINITSGGGDDSLYIGDSNVGGRTGTGVMTA